MSKEGDEYGKMLDQYLLDIQTSNQTEKDLKRIETIERTFSYTSLDFVFPWHMNLGKYESEDNQDFAYTPFKTFNRRRNFLVWLHSEKFQYLFTDEEKRSRQ